LPDIWIEDGKDYKLKMIDENEKSTYQPLYY